ncbi:MAG TPA: ROK family protein [Nocardioidaceae bacterium]|jgi:polyphosphate glucokinase
MAEDRTLVGVDVGGTGIKAALVDRTEGTLVTERVKVDTPRPATPDNVAAVIAKLVGDIAPNDPSPVGVTVPGVVRSGVVHTAANIDKGWIGTDADQMLEHLLHRPVHVMNDADAAGYAEVAFGSAKGHQGIVVITTLGTGIGSALVYHGVLVPNTELGHLEIDGRDAELNASNAARERRKLSWEKWSKHLTKYYRTLEQLFSPDLFVVGGGVSKHAERFLPLIEVDTTMVPAALGNSAGIIGAALLAYEDANH